MKMSINPPQTFEETLDLFQPVPGSEAESDSSHFTDDPEQTYLWSVGALSKQENEVVQSHLCHCQYCQMEVADMVESGAITLPTLQAKPTILPSSSRFTQVHRAILAVCAIGLFGLMLLPFLPSPVPVPVPPIAKFDPKPVDRDWLIADTRTAPTYMSFDDPFDNDPFANPNVSVPPKAEEFDDSLYRSLPESEHTDVYHAAYGQYLLRHGKIAEAKAQFEAINADSVEAALGLSLVAFAEGNYKDALKRFEELGQRNGLSETLQFIVAYNAAEAARELEDWSTARTNWNKALELGEHLKKAPQFQPSYEKAERGLRIYSNK